MASHWQTTVTERTDMSLRSLPELSGPIADGTIFGAQKGTHTHAHTPSPTASCIQVGRAEKEEFESCPESNHVTCLGSPS